MPSNFRWLVQIWVILGALVVAVSSCATPQSTPTTKPASSALPVSTQPASAATQSVPASTNSSAAASQTASAVEDYRLWGTEITLARFVELAKSGTIDYVEWFAEQDRLRIFTKAGERFNYKNEVSKLDIPKYFESQGVKVGEGGLQLEYET
jgi:hypothetical protein